MAGFVILLKRLESRPFMNVTRDKRLSHLFRSIESGGLVHFTTLRGIFMHVEENDVWFSAHTHTRFEKGEI